MKLFVIIAVGANRAGSWGSPVETISRSVEELFGRRVTVQLRSPLYSTSPLGTGPQDAYVNGAFLAQTSLPPDALLRVLKDIEIRSGRRGGRPWGPRTLDLDIIDYKGLIRNWDLSRKVAKACRKGELVLPHALAHTRPFVLQPLSDLGQGWRHPVLRKSAAELLVPLAHDAQGSVLHQIEPLQRYK